MTLIPFRKYRILRTLYYSEKPLTFRQMCELNRDMGEGDVKQGLHRARVQGHINLKRLKGYGRKCYAYSISARGRKTYEKMVGAFGELDLRYR